MPAAARRRLRPDGRPDVLADRRCPASWARRCASRTRSRSRSSAAATGPSSPPCSSCCPPSGSRGPCSNPQLPFGVLLAIAALAGVGGGNFASSMANISFFYPEQEKGKALGLNAAGGNIGTAAVQFAVPLVIVSGGRDRARARRADVHPADPARGRRRLAVHGQPVQREVRPAQFRRSPPATGTPGCISFIYIGTFGSFIGYSGAFPTLLKSQFPEVTLSIAFLGALVGLRRPAARRHPRRPARRCPGHDRLVRRHGARRVGRDRRPRPAQLRASSSRSFLGAVRLHRDRQRLDLPHDPRGVPRHRARRLGRGPAKARKAAAGCLGIAGAIGAFGGFLIPRGFAVSIGAAAASCRPCGSSSAATRSWVR